MLIIFDDPKRSSIRVMGRKPHFPAFHRNRLCVRSDHSRGDGGIIDIDDPIQILYTSIPEVHGANMGNALILKNAIFNPFDAKNGLR
jgi:hypothetical protein